MQRQMSYPRAYVALSAFVADVKPALWRLFVGVGLILVIYVVGVIAYLIGASRWLDLDVDAVANGSGPLEAIVLLSSFIIMVFAVVIATLWPAKRPVISLIGPPDAAWRIFWRVFAAMIPVVGLAFGTSWLFDDSLAFNLPIGHVLTWFVVATIALFIQISAEELAFRGYVMGQLAARFSHPLIWMGLPSVLFGLVHYDAANYGQGTWIICGAITLFALAASDITARVGNLGPALAMHFANNLLAIFLISEQARLDGLALFTAKFDPTDPMQIVLQVLFVGLMWLAARLALKV